MDKETPRELTVEEAQEDWFKNPNYVNGQLKIGA